MRSTLLTVAAAVIAVVGVAAQDGAKLGAGVTLTEATPIAALYESPEKFIGKTIRIDGVVTGVCEEMGCWMALSADGKAEKTIRFKVEHEGELVFPVSARGKKASAQGVFVKIAADDKEANEAAREQTKAQPKTAEFGKTYQVKVTGAVLR